MPKFLLTASDGTKHDVDISVTETVISLPPPTTPTAPTNLTATAVSTTTINLAWKDNSNNESNFVPQRSPNGTTWTNVVSLGANTTVYTASGLTANTKYYFRIKATNAQGSTYSNAVNATTNSVPTSPPPPPPPPPPTGQIAGGWDLKPPSVPVGTPGRTGPSDPAKLKNLPVQNGNLTISSPGTYGGWDRTGDVYIQSDGVILENFILRNGNIDVTNRKNVTIRNFESYNTGTGFRGTGNDAKTFWVEYGAFYAPFDSPIAWNVSARYLYFENVEGDCFAPHGNDGGTIEYCYVNQVSIPPNGVRHADCWQSFGSSNMTVRYNKLVAGTHAGVNSAVVADVSNHGNKFEYNYFDGGTYAFGLRADNNESVVIRGNRWGRSAGYGPVYPTSYNANVIWEDNAFLDNGEVINKP